MYPLDSANQQTQASLHFVLRGGNVRPLTSLMEDERVAPKPNGYVLKKVDAEITVIEDGELAAIDPA